MRSSACLALAVIAQAGIALLIWPWAGANAQVSVSEVLPERDACQPTTSAKSRDGNCMACPTGALSTKASFMGLVAQVRSRPDLFRDIDARIDTASKDPEVGRLLRGRNLAYALYGSDADFIAGGTASRCLLSNDPVLQARAVEFPCAQVPRDGLAVLLTGGQSNIANFGAPAPNQPLYQPHGAVYNYDRISGRCYIARNPLLGTQGNGENVAVRLADDLIDRKLYKAVLIAPVAIGGTYLEEWRARGGKYFELLLSAVAGLRDAGFEPTAVLWHQGEYNARPLASARAEDGTPLALTTPIREAARLSYLRNDLEIIAGLRAADVTAPILVATATICGTGPEGIIRSAQQAVPNPAQGVYPGPDTDRIGTALRSDGCHMSHAGTEEHARMWADRLADVLGRSAEPRQ